MPRFFASREYISESEILLRGDDAFHIARSLRMAVGDTLTVSDGDGTDYLCRLTKIRDSECTLEIISEKEQHGEPKHKITLYMAYPKSDKLEWVVQKSVELGCSVIIPFESSRCIKKPQPEKADKQTARLGKIAEEAAKQSGRSKLPEVKKPISFSELLSQIPEHGLTLFCYEGDGAKSLKEVLSDIAEPNTIAVIVGSEGGFSKEEAEQITASGARCVNLGPRILRCETAPMYALSSISFMYEL